MDLKLAKTLKVGDPLVFKKEAKGSISGWKKVDFNKVYYFLSLDESGWINYGDIDGNPISGYKHIWFDLATDAAQVLYGV